MGVRNRLLTWMEDLVVRNLPSLKYEDEDWSEYSEEELEALDQTAMAYNRGLREAQNSVGQSLFEVASWLAVAIAGGLLENPSDTTKVRELLTASGESIHSHDASTIIALASNLRESMGLSPITNAEELTDAIIDPTGELYPSV